MPFDVAEVSAGLISLKFGSTYKDYDHEWSREVVENLSKLKDESIYLFIRYFIERKIPEQELYILDQNDEFLPHFKCFN